MTAASVSWQLEIDSTLCDAHGICALCCPERISLDQWGYATVDAEPMTSPTTIQRARRAIYACPERALTMRSVQREPSRQTADDRTTSGGG